MSNLIEIKVPDIGDFKNIPVIEVLVKSGDKVEIGRFADHAGIGQGDDGSAVAGCRHRQGTEGQARRQDVPGQPDP